MKALMTVLSSIPYAVLMIAFGIGIWVTAGGRRAQLITAAVLIGEVELASVSLTRYLRFSVAAQPLWSSAEARSTAVLLPQVSPPTHAALYYLERFLALIV
jgi:hypothetical protein